MCPVMLSMFDSAAGCRTLDSGDATFALVQRSARPTQFRSGGRSDRRALGGRLVQSVDHSGLMVLS